MKFLIFCIFLEVVQLFHVQGASTTSSFLSQADKIRLKNVLTSGFEIKDLSSLHYAILGYKTLNEKIPKVKEVCKYLQDQISPSANPETLYYVSNGWKAVGECPGSLDIAAISKGLLPVLDKEPAQVADIYHAVLGLNNIGHKKYDTAKLTKNLQAALKKDDSLLNLGYLFHIGAGLGTSGGFAFERIEDAIVQADEVGSKYLQFEGGLSITALLVSGAYRLAQSFNKPIPIDNDQAVKFSNYFLSRRSVQSCKGAASLLDVIHLLANNRYHCPVAVTLAGPASVSQTSPLLSVRVSDLLGKPITTGLAVTAESATRIGDDVVVLSKKKFENSKTDSTIYQLNLMESRPERGAYRVAVIAAATKPDPKIPAPVAANIAVKVMTTLVVDTAEIGVGDADEITQPRMHKLQHPNKLSTTLEADTQQKIVMRFSLKDQNIAKSMAVHQAFVRLTHERTGQEIIFVTETISTGQYRFDMAIGANAAEFAHTSGRYTISLIIGDSIISNPFIWTVCDITLKFSEASTSPLKSSTSLYLPKPEIEHLFREPEIRPPVFVSNLFTGLVLAPILILFILWAKIGLNLSSNLFSVSSFCFHLGLGGIFSLLGIFWLQLNMFQTLKYLLGLGIWTFIFGNRLLSRLASERKKN